MARSCGRRATKVANRSPAKFKAASTAIRKRTPTWCFPTTRKPRRQLRLRKSKRCFMEIESAVGRAGSDSSSEHELACVYVVIPALNEENSLPRVLADLPAVGRTVVVDNGSTD